MLYPRIGGGGIGFVNQQFTMKHLQMVKKMLSRK